MTRKSVKQFSEQNKHVKVKIRSKFINVINSM